MPCELEVLNVEKLVDKKVAAFVDSVASDAPAPGGGSVAALSSALGAGLLCMAIRISTKKQPDAALSDLLPELEKQKNRLMQLVDEDTAAFNAVMAAFALPKGTDEEKAKRSAAVQTAFKNAAYVPLETMQSSLRVLQAGRAVAEKCSPNVASDVGTAVQMAYAGLQAAGYNVKINLAAIKDADVKQDLFFERNRIAVDAEKRFSYASDYLAKKL